MITRGPWKFAVIVEPSCGTVTIVIMIISSGFVIPIFLSAASSISVSYSEQIKKGSTINKENLLADINEKGIKEAYH